MLQAAHNLQLLCVNPEIRPCHLADIAATLRPPFGVGKYGDIPVRLPLALVAPHDSPTPGRILVFRTLPIPPRGCQIMWIKHHVLHTPNGIAMVAHL